MALNCGTCGCEFDTTSPFLWRSVPQLLAELRDFVHRVAQFTAHGVSRMVLKSGAGTPGTPRSDWPWHESSSAVGADVAQHVLNALGAERAFIAADLRVWRFGRKVGVAQLAVWAQGKHRSPQKHRRKRDFGDKDATRPGILPSARDPGNARSTDTRPPVLDVQSDGHA